MAELNPKFLNYDGSLSDDGRALVTFIESQFLAADKNNDIAALNSLSGMIGHYYVNVHKLHTMTPAQWVKDYPNGAMGAWSAKQFVESKQQEAQQIAENTEKTSTIEAELLKLKEALTEQSAQWEQERTALREEIDALKAGKKPAKKAEPQPDPVETEETPEAEA
jgi:hypothetical protein